MSVDRDRPFCDLEIGVPAGAGTLASVALAVVCIRPVRWLERGAQNPIPSRTRPLNASALMVLRPKARESRSPPGQPNASSLFTQDARLCAWRVWFGAGWSSPVARQAHNLKVTGSNPVPATNPRSTPTHNQTPPTEVGGVWLCAERLVNQCRA